MPKNKTAKTKNIEELKKNLPEEFDARKFRGCKVNADSDKSAITATCKELGFSGHEDAILKYLQYKAVNKKTSKGKGKPTKKEADVVEKKVLLSKRHYRGLSSIEIGKLIDMLSGIQKKEREKDIAALKAQKQQIDKELKEMQAN